jgi:uncharacterized protein YjbI with pentapeptide repeats
MSSIIATHQSITEDQLIALLNERISSGVPSPREISYKKISSPLSLHRIISGSYPSFSALHFINCIFGNTVDVEYDENAQKVFFDSCIFNENVISYLQNAGFMDDCTFNNNLTLFTSLQEEIISGYTVDGTLTINGSGKNITIQKINTGKDANDRKITILVEAARLTIKNVISRQLQVSHKNISAGTVLLQDVTADHLILDNLNLEGKGIIISKCNISFLQIGKIVGTDRSLYMIEEGKIGVSNFDLNSFTRLDISDVIIHTLVLSGVNNKESLINITKAQIHKLRFEKVFNNGLITLRELRIPDGGMVAFRSSNLGKADFIYCKFSKAILEFENSKITEVFLSESDFPKIMRVNGEKNPGQAQLAFGQLATAFQKQGDTIRALEYSSREVEAHYHTVRWFSMDFFKKLNLWLNRISNNFGRFWIQGILFSFAVGLIFFCFLLLSTNQFRWGWPVIDWSLSPAYLKFMNPLRFVDTEMLFKNTPVESVIKLNSFSYLWDFLGRIFVAYGYYQTIQAFRRFGRK